MSSLYTSSSNLDMERDIIGVRFPARILAPQDMPEKLIKQTYSAAQASAERVEPKFRIVKLKVARSAN